MEDNQTQIHPPAVAATAGPAARFPGDRVYACIHWSLMIPIAGILLFRFFAQRYLDFPRSGSFRLLVLMALGLNLLWWSVADRRFARHVRCEGWSRLLRAITAVFAIALNYPMLHMIVYARMPEYFNTAPTWYIGAVTLWQLALIFTMPVVAGIRILLILLVGAWRKATGAHRPAEIDLSRRALLKTSFGSVPMVLLTGGTAWGLTQADRVQVNRREIPAPWLPQRLRGLTITHVSDLHVGRLFRPERLPEIVDIVHRLNSDLVVVTGDVVDISNEMLPPAVDAISQFRSRHGTFLSVGNHDEFDDREEFIREVRERLPLLVDEHRVLQIGGEHFTIAGLDWVRTPRYPDEYTAYSTHARAMLSGHDPLRDGPVIALAHHPHAWDALSRHGVPLVLSGHTHGGQVMFTPPDARPDIGCGSMLFRYLRGIYERPGSTLFVNRGVGNWFPLRINSPAEIVQIRLV